MFTDDQMRFFSEEIALADIASCLRGERTRENVTTEVIYADAFLKRLVIQSGGKEYIVKLERLTEPYKL